ncbi:DUF2461 domain-containing protein [Longimicrobium sp.]|uniref:DUF2461 domain-containing protein n=1 Tax=Longimicrobium sp. TaxID=2029185 RepID=UPI002E37B99E|nr:DUF2461 domain-containing protein [Longimicrobium sp.]HEX6038421.1 DUF2461 domain-containing protein [Longimicrobium sp.]
MDFPALTAFLADLAENNRREWFEAHRPEYQALRDQFTAFVGEVIERTADFDERVRWKDPRDCLFRIYRDVRFSHDKSPYKTTFSAYVSEENRRGAPPGYYLEVDEKGVMLAAAGIWMPPAEPLNRLRASLAEHPERFERVLRSRGFKKMFGELQGDRLTRPPRGYAADLPLIEHIKRKSFIAWRETDARQVTHEGALAYVVDSFRAARPLVEWVRHVLESGGDELEG